MQKIILATNNKGKLKEFTSLVGARPWTVYSLADYPEISAAEETGKTFKENAQIKAVSVSDAAGLITLADDSGLEVDFLDGMPGVYSARFAGEHGDDRACNEKLLRLLDGVPEEKRTARFRCTIAITIPGGETFFCDGTCEGIICREPAGHNGFGYDPLFWLPQFGRTMAQLTMEEKNKISHRGKAFRAALPILERLLSS